VGWLPDLREELKAWLLSATQGGDAALRLVLDPRAGLLSAKLESLPATPQPYRLALINHPLGPRQLDPNLRHKGLSGPWGKAIQAEALRLDANDALLLWPDGTVAETGIAAVGVEVDGIFLVPPYQGRVTSLTERLELPDWAESRGLRIEVQAIPVHRARLGRIWCMNALRGIWPATLL
jgi:branched-subunit amino acid aminotransferase/4-amino-4-deoxychorismate lyase